MKLEPSFYLGNNVVKIAKDSWQGCYRIGHRTRRMIVETEAYQVGARVHAYQHRRTRAMKYVGEGGLPTYILLRYP